MDVVYLNTPIRDKKYEIPVLPQIAICTDIDEGIIVHQNMSTIEDSNDRDEFLNMFLGYIEAYGRPKDVFVRDQFMGSVIYDLCKKININLIISEKMLIIDDFVESFLRFQL